jgi:hypothetical protein
MRREGKEGHRYRVSTVYTAQYAAVGRNVQCSVVKHNINAWMCVNVDKCIMCECFSTVLKPCSVMSEYVR